MAQHARRLLVEVSEDEYDVENEPWSGVITDQSYDPDFKSMTLESARNVADAIRSHSRANATGEIYVFGSIARYGVGGDIDLIVTVGEHTWQQYRSNLSASAHARNYQGRYFCPSSLRFTEGCELLGVSFNAFKLAAFRECVDLFLFPHNWRERLDELQDALPHVDPDFMKNIARDAVLLAV